MLCVSVADAFPFGHGTHPFRRDADENTRPKKQVYYKARLHAFPLWAHSILGAFSIGRDADVEDGVRVAKLLRKPEEGRVLRRRDPGLGSRVTGVPRS